MKIVKTANNKSKITLSKKEWTDIGERTGWMKTAEWEDGYWKGKQVDGYPETYFDNDTFEYPWQKNVKSPQKNVKSPMDLPPDVQFYDDQFPKIPKLDNYFLIKEHQKWGYCPTYRNKDNKDDVLYYYEGKLWRWEELKEELKDTWRPASREEQDWFVTHLANSKSISKKANWTGGKGKFSPYLSFMEEEDWKNIEKNDKLKQQEWEIKKQKLRKQMRQQDEEEMESFKRQDRKVKDRQRLRHQMRAQDEEEIKWNQITSSKKFVAQEFTEKMMPGQTPYTDEEKSKLNNLINDAAQQDPGEKEENDFIKRRRTVRVDFSDGDHLVTEINGSRKEILDYYFKNNEPRDYDLTDSSKKRTITNVRFLS